MLKQRGFTIIELMISVILMALLLTVGVPSFLSMVERSQLVTENNILVGALNLARSESVKRGKTVTICKSTDGISCSTDGNIGLEAGWIIFEEQAAGLHAVGTRDAANEPLIKMQNALDDKYSLRASGNYDDFISYVPSGAISSATASTAGHIVLCLDNDISKARAVFLITTGRAYSGQDSDYNGAPEDEAGNNLTTCTPS